MGNKRGNEEEDKPRKMIRSTHLKRQWSLAFSRKVATARARVLVGAVRLVLLETM